MAKQVGPPLLLPALDEPACSPPLRGPFASQCAKVLTAEDEEFLEHFEFLAEKAEELGRTLAAPPSECKMPFQQVLLLLEISEGEEGGEEGNVLKASLQSYSLFAERYRGTFFRHLLLSVLPR